MATQRDIAQDNYAAYAYARDNGHLDFVKKASTCDEFFAGQQWDPTIRAKLERLGKPVLTINKILPTLAAIYGEQLSHRADVAFRPSKGGNAETADVLDKLWLHTLHVNNYDWLEAQMSAEAFVRSRGFIDLRPSFDDHMQGEARIRLLNSKNVLINPDESAYDPDEWSEVFITKWMSTRDLEFTYGKAAAKEIDMYGAASTQLRYDTLDWLPDTFGGNSPYASFETEMEAAKRRIYRIIERQYKEVKYADHFVNQLTGDMREIPESWDRNRIAYVMENYSLGLYRKKVKKIRWTVSTDTVLLHDAISPLKHFTPIPFFPFFLHGRTIGVVENMLGPQELLNKSTSQELHVINTTANSGWKIKENSLANMTPEELEDRGAEDGLVLVTRGDPDTVASKIQPNQIPTGLDRVSYKADEFIKEVSMVSDSMRGFDRADVAAKAIRAKQARGTVSLASPFNNLDQTRRILCRNMLDLWQHYYTEERVIQMAGRDIADEPQEITMNQMTPEGQVVNDLTVGEYMVVVTTVPARDTFEQTQFDQALEMRREGIAIPDDVLVEHSNLSRKSEIAKRLRKLNGGEEASEQEQQQMQALRQLEIQAKQAEVSETEANAQLRSANAALSAAKAQREMAEAAVASPEQEMRSKEMEMALEREKAAQDLQTKRMQAVADIQLKREKLNAELELMREESREKLAIMKQESEVKKKVMARPQPQSKPTGAKKQ